MAETKGKLEKWAAGLGCGDTIAHGEACVENWLCQHCSDLAELAKENMLMKDIQAELVLSLREFLGSWKTQEEHDAAHDGLEYLSGNDQVVLDTIALLKKATGE